MQNAGKGGTMKFYPKNRHILICLVEEPKEDTGTTILLPEDYKLPEASHGLARVLAVSEDCKQEIKDEDLVAIDKRMLIELKLESETFNLILENYVFGVLGR
tara:strand:+ start:573 stop:878 length:306 start_codon:yes stop_codon:yes gene_type:complete